MTKQAKILVLLSCTILVAVIIQLSFFLYSQHQVKKIHRQEAYAQGVTHQIDQYYFDQYKAAEDIHFQEVAKRHEEEMEKTFGKLKS